MPEQPMTEEIANLVFDVLVDAGAATAERESFVFHQTNEHVTEYRFGGHLGHGGKFYRNPGKLPDGSYGERWYVSYYREDETPKRRSIMLLADRALETFRAQYLAT